MILCILQARTTSSRLPGKVLKPLLGQPMLVRQVERVRRSRLINKLIVATSSDKTDDDLAAVCSKNDIDCFRGDLDDVLDRFYHAAVCHNPDHIVRLTGDCPLMDPALIDQLIAYHLKNGFDYSSNTIEPTYPDGLDIEVFRFHCLVKAWQEAELPSEREHVTPYIINHSELFRLGNFKNSEDLSSLRWTVDEKADFELIEILFNHFYSLKPDFNKDDILTHIKANPHLMDLNACYQRNEGFLKSLEEDEDYKKGK